MAANSCGDIIYRHITKEHLQASLTALKNSFILEESLCQVVELSKCEESTAEVLKLAESAAIQDGVSFMAFDQKHKKIAGFAFNKLHVFKEREDSFFEKFTKSCKTTKARDFAQFMIDVTRLSNLYDVCQTNCLLEVMFLGVLPEYRKQGIGHQLVVTTSTIGGLLKNGTDVRQPLDAVNLSSNPRPSAIYAVATSPYTQKITTRMNFEVAARQHCKDLEYRGKNFTSVLDGVYETLELVYKKF